MKTLTLEQRVKRLGNILMQEKGCVRETFKDMYLKDTEQWEEIKDLLLLGIEPYNF